MESRDTKKLIVATLLVALMFVLMEYRIIFVLLWDFTLIPWPYVLKKLGECPKKVSFTMVIDLAWDAIRAL